MPAPLGHPPYNQNGEGGRPQKYTPEFIDNQAIMLIKWLKDPENIFFEDFLLDQDIHPQRFSEWKLVNQRFSEAYELAYKRQESKLKNGSIRKNYDCGFAKFLLINNHGYSDKTESHITGDANNPFAVLINEAQGKSKDLVNEESDQPIT